jgi:hypothetical protein
MKIPDFSTWNSACHKGKLHTIRKPMPSRRPTSLEEALSFIETNGIVLESAHGRVPTFADFVAGERVTRWWSHPKGRLIFALTRAIRDSSDVLTCRVIDGKVTYVHRRLWPALVKLSDEFDKNDLGAIREEHLPGGKHKVQITEFPQWVPAEVLVETKQLSRRAARAMLHKSALLNNSPNPEIL